MSDVVRLCSKRANRVDWTEYLCRSILCNIVGVTPCVLESCFRGICEGCEQNYKFSDFGPLDMAAFRLVSPSLSITYAENDFTRLQLLLANAAHIEFPKGKDIPTQNADAVIRHCKRLRSLKCLVYHCEDPVRRMLEARRKQLHSLPICFVFTTITRVVAEYCTQLRELYLYSHRNSLTTLLPSLRAQLLNLNYETPLWLTT